MSREIILKLRQKNMAMGSVGPAIYSTYTGCPVSEVKYF
jgi:hypothetical protein